MKPEPHADALPERYRGYEQLQLDLNKEVLWVGLDRPAKRNAIGVEMTLSLEQLLKEIAQDKSVRVVLFHGCGGNFSSGMDMKDFFDLTERDKKTLDRARAATDNWRARLLRSLPQSIICAVDGFCLGGALPLLECSDIVIAADNATFGLPEINFGFVPGGPIAKSTGIAMTARESSYASLTGRSFDAPAAKRAGLISRIVPSAQLFGEARTLAEELVTTARSSTPSISIR
jgi:enoyl-CoA hydratase/carnithine racemase